MGGWLIDRNAAFVPKRRSARRNARKCYECGEEGHLARDCPHKGEKAEEKQVEKEAPKEEAKESFWKC